MLSQNRNNSNINKDFTAPDVLGSSAKNKAQDDTPSFFFVLKSVGTTLSSCEGTNLRFRKDSVATLRSYVEMTTSHLSGKHNVRSQVSHCFNKDDSKIINDSKEKYQLFSEKGTKVSVLETMRLSHQSYTDVQR